MAAKKSTKKTTQKTDKMTQTASEIFEKVKKHAPSEKAVDKWQEEWLSLPEKRKKYEHLTDAPEVAAEEILAMTNDIVDFIQGQEGGKSVTFKKLKNELGDMAKHPVKFFNEKFHKIAKKTEKAAKKTEKAAKKTAEKAEKSAKKAKKSTK